jgi:alanine dehydrogenase
MSEVAGRLAIQAAGEALMRHLGGIGLLLGGVPGVRPASVVVLGGGIVGTQAARMAVGLGAEVTILDRSIARLRELDELFQSRVRTRYSTVSAIKDEIAEADVVVGAVLVPGALAPKLVSRSMLGQMRPGTVLVDVAIDQGGCFETSHVTSYEDPTFVVDGIIHYCVANMPGAVPVTSSKALTNATLPYIEMLAAGGLAKSSDLLNGLNVHNGMITNRAVAGSLGLPFVSPHSALAKSSSVKH